MRALGADFAVCSGYKWLLGPLRHRVLLGEARVGEKLPLGNTYYTALEGARNVHTLPLTKQQAVAGARRWDTAETASFTNLACLDASLDLLLRTGLDKAACHTAGSSSRLWRNAERSLYPSVARRARAARALRLHQSAHAGETTAMQEKLARAEVHVSLREGALRISPFIYNSPAHVSRLIEVLRS